MPAYTPPRALTLTLTHIHTQRRPGSYTVQQPAPLIFMHMHMRTSFSTLSPPTNACMHARTMNRLLGSFALGSSGPADWIACLARDSNSSSSSSSSRMAVRVARSISLSS
eukprot:1141866-Pelagomonas_calceolata.AAC.2